MDVRSRIGLLIQAQGARRAAQDVEGVARPVKRLGQESETAGHKFRAAERQALSFRKGIIGMTSFVSAGAVGVFGLGAVLHGAAEQYRETEKATAATNAVIASTGGMANVTAKDVGELTDSLSLKAGIDDQLIRQGANLLLTFRDIRNEAGAGNDIFNQTTAAAVDMSAAFKAAGKSMNVSDAALQLGKALNDPTKGMGRLMRVGVSFTQQQIDQAKHLQKSGDIMGAQKIILAELTKEFGGAAAATAAPWDRARTALNHLERTLGTALAPTVEGLLSDFASFVTELEDGTGAGGKVANTAKDIWGVVKALTPALIGLTAAFVTYKGVLIATAIYQRAVAAVELVQAFIAAAGATDFLTASVIALDVALDVNPIVLAVAAVVAIGAALYVAYHKVGWFRRGVQAVWGWIKGHWPLLLGILTGPIGPAVVFIIRHWDRIVGFVKGLPHRIGRAAHGMWDGIKDAFRSAVNWIIGKWNALQFHIGGQKVFGVHMPGVTIGTPDIPLLADGGIATAAGAAVVGDDGPELLQLPAGAQVQPLGSGADPAPGIGDRPITLNLRVDLDGRQVGTGVRRVALRDLLGSSAA